MTVNQIETGLPESIPWGSQIYRPEVFLTEEQLQDRISAMGFELADYYAGLGSVHVLTILSGAMPFAVQLRQAMKSSRRELAMTSSEIDISTWGSGMQSSGIVRHQGRPLDELAGKHVLVAEDLVETGLTLGWLGNYLRDFKPASVEVAALFQKMNSEQMARVLGDTAVHAGFEIGPEYHIGFGSDLGGDFRDLTDVHRLVPIPV